MTYGKHGDRVFEIKSYERSLRENMMSSDENGNNLKPQFNITIQDYKAMDSFLYFRFNNPGLKQEIDKQTEILIHVEGEIRRFLKDSLDIDGFIIDSKSGAVGFIIEGDVDEEDYECVAEKTGQEDAKAYTFREDHPFVDTPEYHEMVEKIQAYYEMQMGLKDVVMSLIGAKPQKYPLLVINILTLGEECYLQVTNPFKRSYVLDREWSNYVLSPMRNQMLASDTRMLMHDISKGAYADLTPIKEADFTALVENKKEASKMSDMKRALRAARKNKPA